MISVSLILRIKLLTIVKILKLQGQDRTFEYNLYSLNISRELNIKMTIFTERSDLGIYVSRAISFKHYCKTIKNKKIHVFILLHL